MEYNSVLKERNNAIASKWIDLEIIKVKKSEKDNNHMLSLFKCLHLLCHSQLKVK